MFDYLDGMHSQALKDSKDFLLRVDLCMNWGVSTALLLELHSSHFMGSIIPLMMHYLKQMIEVGNVNWGGGVVSWGKEEFVCSGSGGGSGLAVGEEREEREERVQIKRLFKDCREITACGLALNIALLVIFLSLSKSIKVTHISHPLLSLYSLYEPRV